jgi:hypothetical protein
MDSSYLLKCSEWDSATLLGSESVIDKRIKEYGLTVGLNLTCTI